MFCGACGVENPNHHRFCLECGERLAGSVAEAGERTASPPHLPLVDDVAARIVLGQATLPEPAWEWPEDLPREVIGTDGGAMMLVPGGFFWMGTRKGKKDERPHRLVWLDSYYMDLKPVTRARYRAFCDQTGHRRPPGLGGGGDRPVTHVSWDDAVAYARWALKRLPTEAEWEKAARGIDGRVWPHGDTPPESTPEPVAQFGQPGSVPGVVGRFPAGASPVGCLDMAGLCWEWCHDQYDPRFYPRSAPRNPRCDDGDARYRIARGGACTYSAQVMRAAYRGWNRPALRSEVYGFRCAADVRRFRRPA